MRRLTISHLEPLPERNTPGARQQSPWPPFDMNAERQAHSVRTSTRIPRFFFFFFLMPPHLRLMPYMPVPIPQNRMSSRCTCISGFLSAEETEQKKRRTLSNNLVQCGPHFSFTEVSGENLHVLGGWGGCEFGICASMGSGAWWMVPPSFVFFFFFPLPLL